MATLTCSFQARLSSGGHHPCPGDLPRARLPREALPDPARRREGGGELQWTRRQGRAYRQQVPGRLKHQRRLNEGFSMSSFEGFSSNLALFFLDKSTNNLEAGIVVVASRALCCFFFLLLSCI